MEAAKEVTRFLLGLRGWVEVVFERLNDQMHVTGRYMGDPQSNPFLEALSAFAPFFTIFPNVSALVIRIVGDPRELNLERSDFRQVSTDCRQATLHEVALAMRKVRAATESVEAAKLDAQYVLFPAAWSLAEALLSWLQAANDADRLSALRGYLRWLKENDPRLQVVEELIPLRQDLTKIINAIGTDVTAFQAAASRRNQPWLGRLQATLAQRGVSLVAISNACRAIFQSSAN
jgi:hypothetical protein